MRSSTLVEKVVMQKLLEKHLFPIPDTTNLFKYEFGWDDKRIAEEVCIELTSSHARYVRIELFGQIGKLPKSKSARMKMLERIEVLEAQVFALEKVVKNGG